MCKSASASHLVMSCSFVPQTILTACSPEQWHCLIFVLMAKFFCMGLHVLNNCTHILTVLVTCIEQHAQSQSSNAGLERLQKGSNTLQK